MRCTFSTILIIAASESVIFKILHGIDNNSNILADRNLLSPAMITNLPLGLACTNKGSRIPCCLIESVNNS